MAEKQAKDVMPRLSGKEELILILLLGRPQKYGLQLVRESEGRLRRGTVYVTLGRMEDKGLVESRVEQKSEGVPGIPRRLYRITGLGERALRARQVALVEFYGADRVTG